MTTLTARRALLTAALGFANTTWHWRPDGVAALERYLSSRTGLGDRRRRDDAAGLQRGAAPARRAVARELLRGGPRALRRVRHGYFRIPAPPLERAVPSPLGVPFVDGGFSPEEAKDMLDYLSSAADNVEHAPEGRRGCVP